VEYLTNEGDLVLDPFVGSGTTAVACRLLNRNYIGIEISDEYCKIAESRLKNIPSQLEAFGRRRTGILVQEEAEK
jgi:DNA modification methylase